MIRRFFVMAVVLAAPHALAATDNASSPPMSQAERRLFVDPHLQDIRPPATLRYRFVKAGSLEAGRRDELQVALRAAADGRCCDATGGFVGEPQRLPLPRIDGATANPVVLYFLEHDMREMQRLTRGQPNYFRKRIRLALADAATSRDTTVEYRGRALPAVELRIAPYADDPMRARYERFAAKEYVFVLAAGVPGGVVQLRTRLASPDGAALLEETLTLDDSQPER
jgi:hypothetical protein